MFCAFSAGILVGAGVGVVVVGAGVGGDVGGGGAGTRAARSPSVNEAPGSTILLVTRISSLDMHVMQGQHAAIVTHVMFTSELCS